MGQAKLRKNEIDAIKAADPNNRNRKLIGAYWGYHPMATAATTANITNKPGQYTDDNRGGFEFTHTLLEHMGLDNRTAEEMIRYVYMGAMAQVDQFNRRDPDLLQGMTANEFLDEEQRRLDAIVEACDAANRQVPFGTLLEYAIVACCAISTLVAGGRLKQDEFNGDKFFWRSV